MSSVEVLYVDVPCIEPMPFTDRYRTVRDFYVKYVYKGEVKEFVIPAGYITDGASIPAVLQPFIGTPYSPRFISGALGHDFQYEFEKANGYTVEEMSDLFYEVLKLSNVREDLAEKMRLGVYAYTSVVKYGDAA